MKENYLHDKIRQQEERLKKLEENNKTQNYLSKKILDDINKNLNERDELIKNYITEKFKHEISLIYDDVMKKDMVNIKIHVSSLLNDIKKENSKYITRFISEVILEKQQSSLLFSILINKKILTLEELNKRQKRILKKYDDENINETIKNNFIFTITKSKKTVIPDDKIK